MAGRRRLTAALALSVGLLAAATAGATNGDASWAAGPVHGPSVQPASSQPGLVSGIRGMDERVAVSLVAILTAWVTAAVTRHRRLRPRDGRRAVVSPRRRGIPPRGPPLALQFT